MAKGRTEESVDLLKKIAQANDRVLCDNDIARIHSNVSKTLKTLLNTVIASIPIILQIGK